MNLMIEEHGILDCFKYYDFPPAKANYWPKAVKISLELVTHPMPASGQHQIQALET